MVVYLDGQHPVENTQKDLLVYVHSLKEINCPLGFCQVVMDQFREPYEQERKHTHSFIPLSVNTSNIRKLRKFKLFSSKTVLPKVCQTVRNQTRFSLN